METLNEIADDLEQFRFDEMDKKVEDGRYSSTDDFVMAEVELMDLSTVKFYARWKRHRLERALLRCQDIQDIVHRREAIKSINEKLEQIVHLIEKWEYIIELN